MKWFVEALALGIESFVLTLECLHKSGFANAWMRFAASGSLKLFESQDGFTASRIPGKRNLDLLSFEFRFEVWINNLRMHGSIFGQWMANFTEDFMMQGG